MNQIIIIGRLTRDPEVRYTQSEKAVASFTVAVDRPRRPGKDKETDFLRVQAWEKTAENCEKYLAKGSMVSVQGQLRQETYEKEGEKRQTFIIKADRVEFIGTRAERQERPEQPKEEAPDNFQELNEEVPFRNETVQSVPKV